MTTPPKPNRNIGASLPRPAPTPPKDLYRSTNGQGGTWFDAKEAPDFLTCPVAAETVAILGSLEGDDLAEAKSQLKHYVEAARTGTLTFEDPPAAGELPRFPDMLEIRVQVNPEHENVERRHLLRLYYAEPPDFEPVLLALMFARKPRGGDPDGVQSGQIRVAQGRYERGQRRGATWGLSL